MGSVFLPRKTRAASLPIILLAGVAIKLDSPVFFTQLRAGENGRPFRILKLRAIVADAPARVGEVLELKPLRGPVFKIPNDPRVTRVAC